MAQVHRCPECGSPLEPEDPSGICSRCLLAQGLAELQAEATDVKSAVPPANTEMPGRYTCEREHARGGMGRILLVHDEQLGRDVILKELLGEAYPSRQEPTPRGGLREPTPVAARFVREARIAGQLEHPSIVPVHELGYREDGTLYYTMKYVHGVSLSQAIEQASSLADRLNLLPHVLDVCQAIAYAHSRGVLHRDIKPANIMVGEFGETVVLDWGLARVQGVPEKAGDAATLNHGAIDLGENDNSGKTTFGQVVGTPAYLAPEQAQGRGADERTDVYALGTLLYALLTGTPPFFGENRDGLIRLAATGVPQPVRGLEPRAPAELLAICEKAMKREPSARYQSAKELAEELQRFLSGGLVAAYEYRFTEHLLRFASRYRQILTTVALAALILAGVAVGSYLRILNERNTALGARNDAVQARDEAVRAREQMNQQLYSNSIAFAQAAVETGRPKEAEKAILTAPARYRHWEWGVLAALSHPDVLTLKDPVPGSSAAFPRFSPDGRFIVSGGNHGDVQIWDAHTGKLARRLNAGDQGICKARFSRDSRLVAAPFDEGWLSVWDTDTARLVLHFQAHNARIGSLDFDPSGQTIATVVNDDYKCILWDIRSGRSRLTLSDPKHGFRGVAFSPDGRRVATAGYDGTARVWDAASGTELLRLTGHKGALGYDCVVFSPDGRWIATGGVDRTARLWNAETGALMRVFEGHTHELGTVRFSPDCRSLLTGGRDRNAIIWNLADGKREQVLKGCTAQMGQCDVDFLTRRLVTHISEPAATDSIVRSLDPLYDMVELHGHTGPVTACAFSPDSNLVATGAGHHDIYDDNRAIVWDAATGRLLTIFEGHRGPVNAVTFLSEGERLLTGSADGTAALWEVRSGKRVRTYGGYGVIRALVAVPDGKTFITAGWGDYGRARMWDVETGRQTALLDSSLNTEVDGLALDAPSQYLAVVTRADMVVVWDLESLHEVTRLEYSGPGTAFNTSPVAFSPDGRTLALEDVRGIRLWDTRTWKTTGYLEGHTNSVLAVSYHPQGGRLASSSQDATVRLWDTATGREVMLINNVGPVAFSPDGLTMAKGDGTSVTLRHAFPWRVEEYPGDSGMPLEERIQLARIAREQKVADRERVDDTWRREAEERKECLARLVALDNAKLAWARANGRSLEDTPASAADLKPYLSDPKAAWVCPSGGTYRIGSLKGWPSCSAHGALDSNPALIAQLNDSLASDALEFQIVMARQHDSPPLSQELLEWLSNAKNGDSPAFQQVLGCLCGATSVPPNSLKEVATKWVRQEHRFFGSAVRLAERAAQLDPENPHGWRILGYAELHAGHGEAAVTHFRRGLEKGNGVSAVGLALALVARGAEQDLAEACTLLEENEPSMGRAMYTNEVYEYLAKAAPPQDPQLRERVQALLMQQVTTPYRRAP